MLRNGVLKHRGGFKIHTNAIRNIQGAIFSKVLQAAHKFTRQALGRQFGRQLGYQGGDIRAFLGNGNVTTVELSEALARVVPVDDPHFLYAGDGASAVEQALKIAFQYWVNRGVTGRTTFLAFGDAYHGDTVGALSVGDGGFGTDLFDPLRFPVVRAPRFTDPDCFDRAVALVAAHAHELAAVIVEPVVQGAAGMHLADPADVGRLAAACRGAVERGAKVAVSGYPSALYDELFAGWRTIEVDVQGWWLKRVVLVDKDPDLRNPKVILPNLRASNGIAHAIDFVLLPVNL